MTEAQIAAEKAEGQGPAAAYREWQPRLAQWKHALGDPARRDEAVRQLDGVDNPRAVGAVRGVFAGGRPASRCGPSACWGTSPPTRPRASSPRWPSWPTPPRPARPPSSS